MVDRKFAKASVILIAIAMLFTSIAPAVFAAGPYKVTYQYSGDEEEIKAVMPTDENTYGEGDEVTLKSPTETSVTSGGKTYNFKGWSAGGTKVEGDTYEMGPSDVTFESEWTEEEVISAIVKMYKYSAAESSAEPKSGVPVKISLKEGTVSRTSGSNGKISYTVPEGKETEDGKYEYEIEATAEYLPKEGEISAGEEASILIKERYEATNADFILPDQEGASGGAIIEAGTYTIEGTGSRKLSKTLDGEPSSSIEVSIDENGNIEPFYVYPDDTCSKEFSAGTVKVDREGPVINNVQVEASDSGTKVKSHGIYGKERVNLTITANITVDGAQLDEVYLVGKKDGEETRYDITPSTTQGRYTATINLPEGVEALDGVVLYLAAKDALGNASEALVARTEEASTLTLETGSPDMHYSIDSQPNENGWYKKNPTITVDAQDYRSGLEQIIVYQDGKKLSEQKLTDKETGEVSLDAVPDLSDPSKNGAYTFKVTAEDNSGNMSEETFTIKIDTQSPSVSIEGVKNRGNYSKAPTIKINETERYSGEDKNIIVAKVYEAGAKTPLAEFKTSGKDSLSIQPEAFSKDREYRIIAYAEDAAGNSSKEESVLFIKDSTAPSLSLAPESQPNGNGWYRKLPNISASGADYLSGLKYFAISQDGEVLVEKRYDEAAKRMQTISKKSKIDSPSKNGSYAFKATAIDFAGNKIEKNVKLKIDLVSPVVSQSGVSSGVHYRSVPDIDITNNEKYYNANGAYIYYKVIRDKKTVASSSVKKASKITLPKRYFSVDGRYSVTIHSVDAAGNKSNTLKYSFVRDATSPDLTISGASNGQFYNNPKTITVEVVERFFDTNKVSVSAVRELGGNRNNVDFPWSNDGRVSSSSKNFSDTGTYTITASAVDKAGNSSGTKTLSFTVDTKAPEITITGVQEGKVYTYDEGVYPKVDFKDDYLDSKSVTYTKGGEVVTNPNFEQTRENDGTYTLTATAKDKAGNTTTKVVNFVVNRFGSYFVYPDATKEIMGKALKDMDQDIVIKEHNVSKLEDSDKIVTRDGKKIEGETKTSEKLGDKENVYTHTFMKSNFTEEGAYEINVVSKDEAKNEMESKDENGPIKFFVDRTAPTVTLSGIDPKGNKGEEITVNIDTSDLLTGVKEVKAYVNGSEVAVTANEEDKTMFFKVGSGMRQEVKVTAEDGAGNIGEATETASVSSSSLSLFLNRFGILLAGIGAALLALLGILFALFKRKKKDEEEA